ncbi:MAG: DUF3500 domain-containing protein [Bacteroidia bacterium]
MKYLFILLLLSAFIAPSYSQNAVQLSELTQALLSSMSEEQVAIVQRPFDDPARTAWTNLPVGMAKRPGLRLGDLSPESKIAFHELLIAIFSSQGYLKATSIMKLDDVLNESYQIAFDNGQINEKRLNRIKDLDWDYENYFLTIWGKPDSKEPWGIKFGGHHMSINLSVVGQEVSLSPLFLGTDPAEVRDTKYAGLRVMSKEEDYGFLLIHSLSDEQRDLATMSGEVPGDIITNPKSSQRIDSYYGIKGADMDKEQQLILMRLIEEYIGNLEYEQASAARSAIQQSGVEEIYFAWIGPYERRKPHYYIINGPDFLIEYDNVGFQNDGNHIHTIYRQKGNDFGEDVLKSHYLEHKH